METIVDYKSAFVNPANEQYSNDVGWHGDTAGVAMMNRVENAWVQAPTLQSAVSVAGEVFL
ncbi:MAG: hypothetical protein K8S55_08450 [Phycisphaerae bacterium]|nr:hypothetical protein [Phycisphaerae bacterium]